VQDVMDDPEVVVNVVAVRGLWRSDSDSKPGSEVDESHSQVPPTPYFTSYSLFGAI
jgi:hypothetical protein